MYSCFNLESSKFEYRVNLSKSKNSRFGLIYWRIFPAKVDIKTRLKFTKVEDFIVKTIRLKAGRFGVKLNQRY